MIEKFDSVTLGFMLHLQLLVFAFSLLQICPVVHILFSMKLFHNDPAPTQNTENIRLSVKAILIKACHLENLKSRGSRISSENTTEWKYANVHMMFCI